ncbi:YolD-like family protein [Robertmurraya kyonggiensis]|uniref:YolD-like family protein n=1 Tax=Robertmurraya kyonggiensis TaxID=1037680 RepID=A0A4U1DEQ2_9BACI|nr:YolD-like family protein [Robertmurraya kyonggiensis]TKC19806.1 YolD-like family protein [Robertmurraya kyonggiensis]
MIRDRGKMKWTSMMLPEHVKLLRDWAKEDAYEKIKEVDEQYLEVMNETISEAMGFGESVTITHHQNHKYEVVVGHIHYWDELNGKLHVLDRFEEVHRISLSSIVDVRLTEA